MSVGSRTTQLLQRTSQARRQLLTASYSALTQACELTADDPQDAELVTDRPVPVWSLPRSRSTLALVHPDPDSAWALLRDAHLLREHRVAVAGPWYDTVRVAGGHGVTFWTDPGARSGDPTLSAWVTASVHRIDPGSHSALPQHDPFAGLLDGLDDAPLDDAGRRFLRERATLLHHEWDAIDWPTPPTVILGDRAMAPVHDDGTHTRLALRHPLWRGHREWDLVAARWRSELLTGHRVDHQAYADTYLGYEQGSTIPAHAYIGAWPGYQVVRDIVVLAAVIDTVRRAHLDASTRQQAVHQISCLRGAHPRPWTWGQR
ncbi:hypothetical protein ACIRST_40620 [Kitasatospora sp. NPDC101447]|uniref:hypothetical protein n=1 Tax=Kitasatospora sp. NPDC101447 TaxID=3364102 RepID=UPI003826F8DB